MKEETQAGQGLLVLQDPRETQDSKACLGLVVLQESQVLRVIWDLQEFQVFKVRKVSLAFRELKETKETKASLDLKVFPVPLDPRVPTKLSRGSQGSLVLRVPPV